MLKSRFSDINDEIISHNNIICFTGYDEAKSLILDDFKFNNNLNKSSLEDLNQDYLIIDLSSSFYDLKSIIQKFKKKKKVIFSMNYSEKDLSIILSNDIPIVFTSIKGEEIEAIDIFKHYNNKYVALKSKNYPQENRLQIKTKKYYKFLNYKGELIKPLSFSPWIFDLPKSLDSLLYPIGYNKKKLKRLIYEKTFKREINHKYLNFVYLCGFFKINYDKVVNSIEKDLINHEIFKYSFNDIYSILKNYNEDVILDLLSQENKMNSLVHLEKNDDLIKKCRNWESIVIETKRYNEYLKNGVKKLNQPFESDINMYVPETNIDLFNLGVKYDNCLMKDFNYLEKILNKEIVLFEYKNHCVSINYNYNLTCVENKNKKNLLGKEIYQFISQLKKIKG